MLEFKTILSCWSWEDIQPWTVSQPGYSITASGRVLEAWSLPSLENRTQMIWLYIILLLYTIMCYQKKTQWNESQMAADWKTRNIHLIFRCIFPCADTPSHVLTLPAAHSHNIAGEIWSTKLDHKCSGALRKAGIILFWLQNMDMALGLQTTVGKRTDYNIKIEHNVKVSTQNYMLRF